MMNWRNWIITLLILALPLASMATIANIHCMNDTDSAITQIDLSSTDHCDTIDPTSITKSSLPTECPCECNDTLGCLTNGASGFALTTYTNSDITYFDSQLNSDFIDQLISFQSPPLIRPPIS